MSETLDKLLGDDPKKWVDELPLYQREPILELLKKGTSYEEVAQNWITASAENTYRFAATAQVGNKDAFLTNLSKELRGFLCGDNKYKKERDGLFGEKGYARTYVVSAIAVAIAPYLNVAAAVIAPIIALLIASFGKITINAWCAAQQAKDKAAGDAPGPA